MKTTVLLLMVGVVLATAEKTEKKSDGSEPNARFLGLGGPQFGGHHGISSGLSVQHGGHLGGVGAHHGAGISSHLGLGGVGIGSSFGLGGVGVQGPLLGGFGPGQGGLGLGGLGFTSPVAPPSTCRYWCRTPQGQAYCCENSNQAPSFAGVVKPGQCPPVRPVCPNTRSFLPPATCSNDGACGGFDKCCFDTCLQEHVCKPPIQFG